MQNSIISYDYDGNAIHFDANGNNCMVNLTEMAKPFGKKPFDFLALASTKAFIEALESTSGFSGSETLVRVVNGGTNPGTWAHQMIAIKFGEWLEPKFGVWTAMKTYELMTTGAATLRPSNFEMVLPEHQVHQMDINGEPLYHFEQALEHLGLTVKHKRDGWEMRRMRERYNLHLGTINGHYYISAQGLQLYVKRYKAYQNWKSLCAAPEGGPFPKLPLPKGNPGNDVPRTVVADDYESWERPGVKAAQERLLVEVLAAAKSITN